MNILQDYQYKNDDDKRALVVIAALEIIKASVSSTSAYAGRDKLLKDIEFTKDKVDELADAIQTALERK
ncbi:TPA: hypothetical protein SMI33_002714 [Serratia marcescens]|nr:hypothetical protein [Serratia marcescens]